MSDREIIIKSLKNAERRIRTNRLLGDLTFGLSLFLLFPVGFKILDLITPFRGRTVVAVLSIWFVSFIAYFVFRTRRNSTLAEAAAEVDSKAGLCDELKSAYWFITNPRSSEWVDQLIRRSAAKMSSLNIDILYPRSIPRGSYVAAGLIAAVVVLNFLPFSWNHNWFYLQAAPAFTLTDSEQNLVQKIQDLIRKADSLKKTGLAERLQEIVKELEEGKIDMAEALRRIQDVQKDLAKATVDASAIAKDLDEIANAFEGSDQLAAAAEALKDKDVDDAGQELKNLSDKLAEASARQIQDMEKSLQDAANKSENLSELSKDMSDAAQAMSKGDMAAAKDALQKAADYLKDLKQKIQDQKLADGAGQDLKDLQNMLKPPEQQAGDKSGDPQGAQGPQGDPSFKGDGKSEGQQAQNSPDMPAGNEPGMGSQTHADPNAQAPSESEQPTSLEVQLEQEKLSGKFQPEKKPTELEEKSKQERSTLDYRNVRSELSPSQRDLLNPERIPLEYRNLIKDYFEAIKPPREKQ